MEDVSALLSLMFCSFSFKPINIYYINIKCFSIEDAPDDICYNEDDFEDIMLRKTCLTHKEIIWLHLDKSYKIFKFLLAEKERWLAGTGEGWIGGYCVMDREFQLINLDKR